MAYRASSGSGSGVMMPHHSKRHPQYQQQDHDWDDCTPDWFLLRHSCGALNRNLLMRRFAELYSTGGIVGAIPHLKPQIVQFRAAVNSNAQLGYFLI